MIRFAFKNEIVSEIPRNIRARNRQKASARAASGAFHLARCSCTRSSPLTLQPPPRTARMASGDRTRDEIAKPCIFQRDLGVVQSEPRRGIRTSTRRDVLFKSRHQIEIPKTDFFDYIFGDIAGNENKVAIIDGLDGTASTYGEAKENSQQLGRAMINRGYRRGDVVAILSPNVLEYTLTIFGCAYAGITVALLNPVESVFHLRQQLAETNVRAIFVFPRFANRVADLAKDSPNVKEIIIYSMPRMNHRLINLYAAVFLRNVETTTFASLLQNSEINERTESGLGPKIDANKDVLILPFSSGTTGMPKGVIHTHASAIAFVESMCQIPMWQKVVRENMNSELKMLAILPLFHMLGFIMACGCLRMKGFYVTNPKFTTKLFLKTVEKHRINFIPVVPFIVDVLATDATVSKYDVSSLRMLFSSAAPLNTVSADKLVGKLPNLRIDQGFGMTEALVCSTLEEDLSYASAGRLCPNGEAKVFDLKTGEELGYNEVGEIMVRNPTIMKGYWGNAEATRESFLFEEGIVKDGGPNDGGGGGESDSKITANANNAANENVTFHGRWKASGESSTKIWLKTGDVGFFCESEIIHIVDRIKEMIKYKGNQVSPVAIESHVLHLAGIRDAAVVGIPDPKAGEIPLAFVVKEEGANVTGEEIKRYVAEGMTAHDELRGGVVFIDAQPGIPRSVAGKILRRQLKQTWLDRAKLAK